VSIIFEGGERKRSKGKWVTAAMMDASSPEL